MRLARTIAVVIGTVFGLLAGVIPASAAPAAPHYVALGDSYAAGVGAKNYDPASKGCKRSANAYSALWAKQHAGVSYTSVACLGATTSDVLDTQLAAVTEDTTLITITIGGNDIGFATVIQSCVLGDDQKCLAQVAAAETAMTDVLPAKLDQTYQAIRQRAPEAKVVVVGYPRLFELGSCPTGLSIRKRTALDHGADLLAGVIGEQAQAAGFAFADVRSSFDHHGVCSGDKWIHGLTYPLDESYHPTVLGQTNGYLPVVAAKLG